MSLKNHRVLLLFASACLLACAPLASVRAAPQVASMQLSPAETLRSARAVFIRSKSVYFKPSALENSLLQQDEFVQRGMSITRNEVDADLIIEVGRKAFTTNFIYSVIDPKTQRVIASGRVNSIGGTVEGKITSSFMKKLRAAR
jgi:hypothetical protein